MRGSRLWRSTGDGSWVELALPEADADGRKLRFSGPAWTPSGFVLAVTTAGQVDGQRHSELWHSEDGLVWTVVAESTSPIGALASGPTGSFAFTMPPSDPNTGFLRPVPPVVLTSEDGRSWCSAEHAAFENAAMQDGDVGPQGRVLAVGYSEHVNGAALIWRGVPAGVEQTPCQAASPSSEAPASITLDQMPS